ncbi:MAG: ribosome small subunit-dependent GTPase A [Bacteroidetes bacterium]|nr:MAG: ribosome small subunit-dependent GTPase A [Bacteroidota bacterium]
MKGIVTKSTGSWYSVLKPDGTFIECRLKGKFKVLGIKTTNPLAVGDHVVFRVLREEGTGVITQILPRKNYIIRKATKLSKLSHILAANLDQAIIIVTLAEPRTSTGFIDRFLITAEAYHIPAAIIFNKIDLYNDGKMEELSTLKSVYEAAGYPCYAVSALTGENTGDVIELLKDRVSLVAGHSGVGKSALINTLEPGLDLKTKPISRAHKKGVHTTTFAMMFRLSFGGFIIDTPGIKEFGLYDLDRKTLAERYPELRALMHACKYTNCTHLHEPGCAVKEAVKNGEISMIRYDGYLRIMANDEP